MVREFAGKSKPVYGALIGKPKSDLSSMDELQMLLKDIVPRRAQLLAVVSTRRRIKVRMDLGNCATSYYTSHVKGVSQDKS